MNFVNRVFLPLLITLELGFPFQVFPANKNTLNGCEKRLTIASKYKDLVTEPVVNLYDSIPVNQGFRYGGLYFLTLKEDIEKVKPGWEFAIETQVLNKYGESVGSVERWFSKDLAQMNFVDARLTRFSDPSNNVPQFINNNGIPPLVREKGNPTLGYLTWMQMKIAKIPYGGLKTAESGEINNVVTALELIHDPSIKDWLRRNPEGIVPSELISKAILKTATGRYISTVLTQSGHHIDKIEVSDTQMAGVYDFSEVEIENNPYVRFLRKGLSNRDQIPISFRLKFTLSPLSK